VHGIVSEISQQEREGVQQNDVDVMVSEDLCFREGFFQFLLDEYVNLVQILQEGAVQVLLDVFDVLEQCFDEAVEADHACEYSADSEVLAGDIKKVRIKILYFEDGMNLVECNLDDFLIRKLLLDVKEVIHQLADIPDCV
jgi:hypothetical protein